jgi:glucosyl-dolichyl phosphate glucuronosyltransferase
MTLEISAVIVTHNRSGYLARTIDSLAHQTLARERYEIVVVDNASTDNTRQMVESCMSLGNLRYVYQPIIGTARTRNAGWRNARSPYVAYLDDDALAAPDWLEKILAAFELFGPQAGVLGGPIDPLWEAPQPSWLSDQMLGCFSVYHWSEVPAVLTPDQWLSSCNIAYPRQVLEETGGFREDLGRRGNSLMANEEPDLSRRIEARGYQSVYHPDVQVRHHVMSSKLNKPWFRRYSYSQGQSTALMESPGNQPLPRGERLSRAGRKAVWVLPRLGLAVVTPNEAARFRRQCQVLEVAGYVAGLVK